MNEQEMSANKKMPTMLEIFQILLVFPRASEEYKEVYEQLSSLKNIKDIKEEKNIKEEIQENLRILLKVPGNLKFPLKDKLHDLPNLHDQTTESFEYEFVVNILQNLAGKNSLSLLVLTYLQTILTNEDVHDIAVLKAISILLHRYYTKFIKKKIAPAIKKFLTDKSRTSDIFSDDVKSLFESTEWTSVEAYAKVLVSCFEKFKQYLYHSDQELRLEARGIVEALRIPLGISLMATLSIDGMQEKNCQEDSVLVVGTSRSGKSTLINYIGGIKFNYETHSSTGKIFLSHESGRKVLVKVGHGATSETLFPTVVSSNVEFRKVLRTQDEEGELVQEETEEVLTELLTLIDTPGSGDNRENEEKACAVLGVPLAIHHTNNVRALVVVIPFEMTVINSNASTSSFRTLCHTLNGILKDPEALLENKELPTSLIFAITKPPVVARGQYFSANKLHSQVIQSILEIKSAKQEDYDNIDVEEKKRIDFDLKIQNLTTCLEELSDFMSLSASSSLGKAFKFFASKFSKTVSECGRAQAIQEHISTWKGVLDQPCIDRLEVVLRKSLEAEVPNVVVDQYRKMWEEEQKGLMEKRAELDLKIQNTMSEKIIFDLMLQRSDNIFIMRGYEGINGDTADHREEFLTYLSSLRNEKISIEKDMFKIDPESNEIKIVRAWVENKAKKNTTLFKGLLSIPTKIEEIDEDISLINKNIEGKQALLTAQLTTTSEQQIENALLQVIINQEREMASKKEDIKKILSEIKANNDEISEIDHSPAVEYDSACLIDNPFFWFGRYFTFLGEVPKRNDRNRHRTFLQRVAKIYPGGYDCIPIEYYQLIEDVFQREFRKEHKRPVCTGNFIIQEDLAKGKLNVVLFFHRGVRVFVLPKNIPVNVDRKIELEEANKRNEVEHKLRDDDLIKLNQNLGKSRAYANLMKKGMYDQANKIESTISLLQELAYDSNTLVSTCFKNVSTHIAWLRAPGKYVLLEELLYCTAEQAAKLGVDKLTKDCLFGFIIGQKDEGKHNNPLPEYRFQALLEELPPSFFKEMYAMSGQCGLAMKSLLLIFNNLDSANLASSVSLLKQLQTQKVRKAAFQYLFEALQARYFSSNAQIRALDKIIDVLELKTNTAVAGYIDSYQEVKNLLTFHYPVTTTKILQEVINSLFVSVDFIDAWSQCTSCGISREYLKAISGQTKAENDSDAKDSVTKIYFEISLELHKAVEAGDQNQCVQLLVNFFKLGTNAAPTTLDTHGTQKPVLFTLAEFGRTAWLKEAKVMQYINLNVMDQQGNTALHQAALYGQQAFGEALIESNVLGLQSNGKYVWCKNKSGATPFHAAAENGHVTLIEQWAEKYKAQDELLSTTAKKDTIIHILVRKKQTQALSRLMKQYSYLPVRALNADHQDPLHLALANQDQATTVQLLEYSVDLANRNAYGRTALHEAVRLDWPDVVEKLLAKGADPRLTDDKGISASACAPHSLAGVRLSQLELKNQPAHHLKIEAPTWLNLVFQGGGVKGFVYPSALRTLVDEQLCDLSKIERVAGTSAGAITALLVGLNYSLEEIDHICGVQKLPNSALTEIKFVELLDGPLGTKLLAAKNQNWKELFGEEQYNVLERVKGIDGKLVALARLLDGTLSKAVKVAANTANDVKKVLNEINKDFGLCPGKELFELFQRLIAFKCKNGTITFEELSGYGYKDMYFVGVNTATGEPEVFSKDTTPKMMIANAVRISMSIPGVFKPCPMLLKQENGSFEEGKALYVDGGVLWNYPINIFDFEGFRNPSKDKKNEKMPVINKQTLGLRLAYTKRLSYYEEGTKLEEQNVSTVWQHIQSLALSLIESEEKNHARTGNQFRTIYIDPLSVKCLDFEKIDDKLVKQALIAQGRQAVLTFKSRLSLSDYSSITLPPKLLKKTLKYATGNFGVLDKLVQITGLQFKPHPALVAAYYSYSDPNIQSFLHQNLCVSLWSRDENLDTAFHFAARKSQLETLQRLLKADSGGALAENMKKQTPKDLATSTEIINLLDQHVLPLEITEKSPEAVSMHL